MPGELNLALLAEPFTSTLVDWRMLTAWKRNGRFGGLVVPYIGRYAIFHRLDEVCGPGLWQVEYREGAAHLMAGIGIRVEGTWIWKWDGAGHMEQNDGLSVSDAGKGDFTNSLKRAGAAWGLGRYLDQVPHLYAICYADENQGRFRGKLKGRNGEKFSWDPPELPSYALPEGEQARDAGEDADPATGEIQDREVVCPICDGALFDNRADKEAGRKGERWPDLKCKERECGWAMWIPSYRDALLEAVNQAVAMGLDDDVLAAALRDAARRERPSPMLRAREKLLEIGAWEEPAS